MERESSLREQRERLRAARKKRDRERSESSSGGSLNVKSGEEIRRNASCDETLPSTRTDASQNDNTDDSTNLVSGSKLASNSTNLVEAKDEVGEIAAFTARQREASGGESVVSESTMSALSESGASGTNPWESQWSRDKSDPQFSARELSDSRRPSASAGASLGILHVRVIQGLDLTPVRTHANSNAPATETASSESKFSRASSFSSPRGIDRKRTSSTPTESDGDIDMGILRSASLDNGSGGKSPAPLSNASLPQMPLPPPGVPAPFLQLSMGDEMYETSKAELPSAWTWNEDFCFQVHPAITRKVRSFEGVGGVDPENQKLPSLLIACRDASPGSLVSDNEGVILGSLSIPLARLPKDRTVEQWYQFQDETSSKKRVSPGKQIMRLIRRKTTIPSSGALLLRLFYDHDSSNVIPRGPSRTFSLENAPRIPSALDNKAGSDGTGAASNDGAARARVGSESKLIPRGIADYFVVVAPPECADEEESPPSHDVWSQGVSNSTEPCIVRRYPSEDIPGHPIPLHVEWFCFPEGGDKVSVPRNGPEFHTFIHSPVGEKLYGYCMTVREERADGMIVAKCFCFMSRLPFASFFYRTLQRMYTIYCSGDDGAIDRALQLLMEDVPVPIPGTLAVSVDDALGLDSASPQLVCSLPPLRDFPAVPFPIFPLSQGYLTESSVLAADSEDSSRFFAGILELVTVDVAIDVWSAALQESKILIHSAVRGRPTAFAESLTALLYPFLWQHTYLPVVPSALVDCVESPMPFILGMSSGLFESIPRTRLEDVYVVDIDAGVAGFVGVCSDDTPAEGERVGGVEDTNDAKSKSACLDDGNTSGEFDVSAVEDDGDDDEVSSCESPLGIEQSVSVPPVPHFEHERLRTALLLLSGAEDCEDADSVRLKRKQPLLLQRAVRLAFLEAVCSLLQGYHERLFFLNMKLPVFNVSLFLSEWSSRRTKAGKAMRIDGDAEEEGDLGEADGDEFMTILFSTQMFEDFKESQGSERLSIFDSIYFALQQADREEEFRRTSDAANAWGGTPRSAAITRNPSASRSDVYKPGRASSTWSWLLPAMKTTSMPLLRVGWSSKSGSPHPAKAGKKASTKRNLFIDTGISATIDAEVVYKLAGTCNVEQPSEIAFREHSFGRCPKTNMGGRAR